MKKNLPGEFFSGKTDKKIENMFFFSGGYVIINAKTAFLCKFLRNLRCAEIMIIMKIKTYERSFLNG